MALPVVGKFYNKLYRDPAFRDYKNHPFPQLDESTLAMLDIPHFKETNKENRKSNFWNIFSGNPQKQEAGKKERLEKSKEIDNQSNEKNEAAKDEPRQSIWKKIKEALKKKE